MGEVLAKAGAVGAAGKYYIFKGGGGVVLAELARNLRTYDGRRGDDFQGGRVLLTLPHKVQAQIGLVEGGPEQLAGERGCSVAVRLCWAEKYDLRVLAKLVERPTKGLIIARVTIEKWDRGAGFQSLPRQHQRVGIQRFWRLIELGRTHAKLYN